MGWRGLGPHHDVKPFKTHIKPIKTNAKPLKKPTETFFKTYLRKTYKNLYKTYKKVEGGSAHFLCNLTPLSPKRRNFGGRDFFHK